MTETLSPKIYWISPSPKDREGNHGPLKVFVEFPQGLLGVFPVIGKSFYDQQQKEIDALKAENERFAYAIKVMGQELHNVKTIDDQKMERSMQKEWVSFGSGDTEVRLKPRHVVSVEAMKNTIEKLVRIILKNGSSVYIQDLSVQEVFETLFPVGGSDGDQGDTEKS